MWNSYDMVQTIRKSNLDYTKIIVYPNVGHAFGIDHISDGYHMGGDDDSNKQAFDDSFRKIISTLNDWYKH